MPESEAEKTYSVDQNTLFRSAKDALEEMGARVKEEDEKRGVIKASKRFHLIKKAKFEIKLEEAPQGTKIDMTSSISALMMAVIDIGKNKRYIKRFFELMDRRV